MESLNLFVLSSNVTHSTKFHGAAEQRVPLSRRQMCLAKKMVTSEKIMYCLSVVTGAQLMVRNQFLLSCSVKLSKVWIFQFGCALEWNGLLCVTRCVRDF